MTPLLASRLEALYRETDHRARLEADPVSFAHRYRHRGDVEVAAVFAASMAYGRADLFRPAVAMVLDLADAHGGPLEWVAGFDPSRDGPILAPLVYRWTRGIDLVLLAATLGRVWRDHGGLEALFAGWTADRGDVREVLAGAIADLREIAVSVAPECGVAAGSFADLPRGFRYFLPSPAGGSACKRWNMLLRWLVRPPDEGVDFGLWTALPPSALVIPLDTHVLRIARFVGLTARNDGSWRTAREITDGLAALDPVDPVRFDFAIAHLGISRRCRGHHDPDICPACTLRPVCLHGAGPTQVLA